MYTYCCEYRSDQGSTVVVVVVVEVVQRLSCIGSSTVYCIQLVVVMVVHGRNSSCSSNHVIMRRITKSSRCTCSSNSNDVMMLYTIYSRMVGVALQCWQRWWLWWSSPQANYTTYRSLSFSFHLFSCTM